MRAAIIATGGHLDRQILRTLLTHGINGDIVSAITKRVIDEYGCVILSDHLKIPNLPVAVERLILEQSIHVIYIAQNPSIGPYYSVMNDMYFHHIQQFSIEVELPLLLRTIDKFDKPLQHMKNRHDEMQQKYDTIQLTNKAKRILIERGYSEEDAHQFIQKTAMDMRVSKKKLVSLIIENKIDI